MHYKPTHESLSTHTIPNWYHDAKVGIFVHWGLYSIPAYAKPGDKEINLLHMDFAEMPYSEWYYNKLRIKGSSTQKYHNDTYGEDFSYFDFQQQFEDKTNNFDAGKWAELFEKAGAKYVILTSKHHDGYLLWPSEHKNKHMKAYHAKNDLVGEVCDKIRAKGLKMGLYYSGVYDWTYNTKPIKNYIASIENLKQSKAYVEYATQHFYELIDRYKPSVLWNDIGYPVGYDLNQLFAHYYNTVPEGVINDRWKQSKVSKFLTLPIVKSIANKVITAMLKKISPEKLFEGEGDSDLHTDYATPEYVTFKDIRAKKFEATRGIGHSFAYNKMEDASHMISGRELIHMLIDVVSKNGNLLINVGPKADGTIPDMQQKPLLEMGAWLQSFGEAIYGTRPWTRAEGETQDGKQVCFTQKGNTLYAMVLGALDKESIILKDLPLTEDAKVTLLGYTEELEWHSIHDGVWVSLPEIKGPEYAYVLKLENGAKA